MESQGKSVSIVKNLRIIQNKSLQKDFYSENNLPTSDYKNYSNLDQVKNDLKNNVITLPAVWKSAKFGYDGKGVKILNTFADLNNLPNVACLIEEKVSISKEISVIVARNQKSQEAYFPVVEMEFNPDSNLVEYIMCPAVISNEIQEKAIKIAIETAKKMNCIGLLAVELFITKKNHVLINEVAPRPHNSGHHTIECCMTSQFDQHLRCILNLPLSITDLKLLKKILVGQNQTEGDVVYQNINKVLITQD